MEEIMDEPQDEPIYKTPTPEQPIGFTRTDPDGSVREKLAYTPAEAVKLRFDGWREKPAGDQDQDGEAGQDESGEPGTEPVEGAQPAESAEPPAEATAEPTTEAAAEPAEATAEPAPRKTTAKKATADQPEPAAVDTPA